MTCESYATFDDLHIAHNIFKTSDCQILSFSTQVAGCVNSVSSGAPDGAVPVPIRRDYFDALQDGRGLAAILAFYRPDLVSLSQLSFATDAEAVAAAPATITAALHSASRASCPCPLSADDVAAKSALLRPVRVALMCPLTACGCVRTCVRASLCLYLCVHVGWSV